MRAPNRPSPPSANPGGSFFHRMIFSPFFPSSELGRGEGGQDDPSQYVGKELLDQWTNFIRFWMEGESHTRPHISI